MLGKMSKYMSEYMTWNARVGITRSKVITFAMPLGADHSFFGQALILDEPLNASIVPYRVELTTSGGFELVVTEAWQPLVNYALEKYAHRIFTELIVWGVGVWLFFGYDQFKDFEIQWSIMVNFILPIGGLQGPEIIPSIHVNMVAIQFLRAHSFNIALQIPHQRRKMNLDVRNNFKYSISQI